MNVCKTIEMYGACMDISYRFEQLGDPTHFFGVNLIERWLIFRLSEVQEHSNLKFEWFES